MGEKSEVKAILQIMNNAELIDRLNMFMEYEARSCSMDFGFVTPEYVFRMWGGKVPFEQIEEAFRVHGSRLMGNS